MMTWQLTLARKAELRRKAGLNRQLRIRGAAVNLLDLAGNDYLGLARHPRVLRAAGDTLNEYGLGATGSRLVNGSTKIHETLEATLSTALGGEALLFSSGYLANLGAIRGLARRDGLLVHDAHAHASLIDGCRLSGVPTTVMPHSDPQTLAAILARHPGPAVVIVESVYSVHGDLAPLRDLYKTCRVAGAILLVDEAHALGMLGPDGAGGVAAAGLSGADNIVITATLSKALASAGGLIVGPRELRRHIIDTGRTFIFDTASPPAVAAGALAAWQIAVDEPHRRATVSRRIVHAAEALGVTVPAAGVLSVPVDDARKAVAWADRCRALGVAVGCFRPPATPDRRSYIRLTANAELSQADFDRAIDLIVRERP